MRNTGLYDKPYDLTGVGTGWTRGQFFLLRPNTGMEYRNFGWERYRERGVGFDWLPTYDQLGEPWIASSATVFSWIEDRTRAPDFSSSFGRSVGRHNGIVIARESFKNSVARVYVGDAVRTTFTSLTLDLSRFTGVRADAVIGQNHELTLLATRPSDPRLPIRLNVVGDVVRDQGTLLGGGHWEGALPARCPVPRHDVRQSPSLRQPTGERQFPQRYDARRNESRYGCGANFGTILHWAAGGAQLFTMVAQTLPCAAPHRRTES